MKESGTINSLFLLIIATFVGGVILVPSSSLVFLFVSVAISLLMICFNKHKTSNLLATVVLFFCLGNLRSVLKQIQQETKLAKVSEEVRKPILFKVDRKFNEFENTNVYLVRFSSGYHHVKGFVYLPKSRGSLLLSKSYISFASLQLLKPKSTPYKNGYYDYLKASEITHKLYINNVPLLLPKEATSLYDNIQNIKISIVKKLDTFSWSPKVLGFLKAFVLGDRTSLNTNLKNDFKNAGLMHILAISGLHIGILHQILIFLFRRILYLYRYRWVKSVLILLLLWIYVCFVGAPISAVRAAIMFSLFEISTKLYRKQHSLDILGLFVFIILLVNPLVVNNVGFQLSVVAVFSIIVGMPIWKRIWTPKSYIILKVWELLGVSIFAQLGLLPLLIHYFHQFPVLFLVSNIPVLLVLPIVFITSLVVVLVIQLPLNISWFLEAYDLVIHFLLRYIQWVSSFENLILKELRLTTSTVFIIYAIVIYLLYSWYTNRFYLWKAMLGLNLFLIYSIGVMCQSTRKSELWIIEEENQLFLADRSGNKLNIHSNTSNDIRQTKFLKYWINEQDFKLITTQNLQNSYTLTPNTSLKLIDSEVIPSINKGDVCILGANAKLNLERILIKKPSVVLFSSAMKSYLIKKYISDCELYAISMWNMKSKGGYSIFENTSK